MTKRTRTVFLASAWSGLVLLLFVLRLFHNAAILDSPPGRILIIDSLYYFQWAQKIISGNGLGPTVFFMSPLYPLFIAFSSLFNSNSILATYTVQVVLSALTLALLGRFTVKRFGHVAGLIAGTLYVFYAPSIFYDGILLSASLILFFTAVILTLADYAIDTGKKLPIILCGVAIGLSALARPIVLILLPAFAIVFIKRWKKYGWEQSGIFIVSTLIVLFPASLRNYLHGGEWYLTTNSAGINFFIGNHENSNGLYTEAPWLTSAEPANEAGEYRSEASKRIGKPLSVGQASRFWMQESIRWIIGNPVDWIGLLGKKAAYFLNRTEAPNNVSFYGTKEYSRILNSLSFLNFGLLAPLGIVGLFLARKETGWSISTALVAGYFLANILFFVSGEYRYPVVFVLFAYGAGAIIRTFSRLKERKIDSAQQAMIGILFFLMLCNIPWKTMKTITSPRMDYFNWGSVSFARGDLANASLLFTASLAWDPTWVEAHIQLAQVYDEMRLPELADKEYAAAGITRKQLEELRLKEEMESLDVPDSLLTDDSVSPEVLAEVGFRFNKLYKHRQAALILQRAVKLDSTNLEARFQYGYALESTGQFAAARDVYQRLEVVRNNDPLIPYRLSWIYYMLGDRGTANACLRRTETKAATIEDKEIRKRWLEIVESARSSFLNY